MEIDRIKVKEYHLLADKSDYDFAMKFAFAFTIPEDVFEVGQLEDKSFGMINEIKQLISRNDFICEIEILGKLTGLNPYEFYLDEFTRQMHYVGREIEKLVEKERRFLTSQPTDKEIRAGLERFDGLGLYLQERALANGDITKIAEVRKMKYRDCFTELYTRKQEREFNNAYSKLK